MGEGSRVDERTTSCFREGLWQKPDTRGMHRGPL